MTYVNKQITMWVNKGRRSKLNTLRIKLVHRIIELLPYCNGLSTYDMSDIMGVDYRKYTDVNSQIYPERDFTEFAETYEQEFITKITNMLMRKSDNELIDIFDGQLLERYK